MTDNLIRKLSCILKERDCCNKGNSCNHNKKVIDVRIIPVEGIPGEKQLLVLYEDGTQSTHRYNDPVTSNNTYIEKFKIENSILKGVYNTKDEIQVLNLRNYVLARDFRELAAKVESISDYLFEEVFLDYNCNGNTVASCIPKPFREGDSIYYYNEKGEKVFLFTVTDSSSSTPPAPPAPEPPAPPAPTIFYEVTYIIGESTIHKNVVQGQSIVLNAPSKENHTFIGWEANGSIISTSPEFQYTPTGNITIIASYRPVSVEITNTSYVIESNQEVQQITLTSAEPSKNVCFNYEVFKITSKSDGSSTREKMTAYTTNTGDIDYICADVSNPTTIPLVVDVEGNRLIKEFGVEVSRDLPPDNGVFDIDFDKSTAVLHPTSNGAIVPNLCDGNNDVVEYNVVLTEYSNVIDSISPVLPVGLYIKLRDDRKGFTININCRNVENVNGKTFTVFDAHGRTLDFTITAPASEPPILPTYIEQGDKIKAYLKSRNDSIFEAFPDLGNETITFRVNATLHEDIYRKFGVKVRYLIDLPDSSYKMHIDMGADVSIIGELNPFNVKPSVSPDLNLSSLVNTGLVLHKDENFMFSIYASEVDQTRVHDFGLSDDLPVTKYTISTMHSPMVTTPIIRIGELRDVTVEFEFAEPREMEFIMD